MLHRVCLEKNVNRHFSGSYMYIHSKAVLDDSWITVDTTSLHQHKLY